MRMARIDFLSRAGCSKTMPTSLGRNPARCSRGCTRHTPPPLMPFSLGILPDSVLATILEWSNPEQEVECAIVARAAVKVVVHRETRGLPVSGDPLRSPESEVRLQGKGSGTPRIAVARLRITLLTPASCARSSWGTAGQARSADGVDCTSPR